MINRRFAILFLVFIALTALIAACGPGGGGSTGGGGTAALDVTVTATEFKFDPATITAKAGQTVNVTLKNAGTVKHTFVLKEANVNLSADPGQSTTGSFTAPAAGTYTFICDQPGHSDAGMKGTLTVQ